VVGKHFIESIIPDKEQNFKIVTFALFLGLISCIVTVLGPTLALLSIILLLLILSIFFFKIHILQILFLTTIIPLILPAGFEKLTNFAFAIEVIVSISWILMLVALGYGHLEHNRSLHILIAINLLFALNMFISSVYNSTFSILAIKEVVRYIFYAGLIVIFYHFMSNMRVLMKLMWTAVAASFIIATYSYILAFSTGIGTFLAYGGTFLHGMSMGLSNSNTVATAIANPIPILLAYIMFKEKERNKWPYIALALFLIIIWLSWNSRASYVFLFSAFMTLLLFHRHRWKYYSIIIVAAIGGYILIMADVFPLLDLFLRLEGGMTYRDVFWKAALRMFSESPLLGKGPGFFDHFKYIYMEPSVGRMMAGTLQSVSPHNVLIMRAVDMGFMAVLMQMTFWLLPVFKFAKKIKEIEFSEYKYIYIASLSIWIGIIFRSIFDTGVNVFSIIQLAVIYKMPDLIRKHQAKLSND